MLAQALRLIILDVPSPYLLLVDRMVERIG